MEISELSSEVGMVIPEDSPTHPSRNWDPHRLFPALLLGRVWSLSLPVKVDPVDPGILPMEMAWNCLSVRNYPIKFNSAQPRDPQDSRVSLGIHNSSVLEAAFPCLASNRERTSGAPTFPACFL